MKICSIILSAGKSSRMNSSIPKPFHKIAGKKIIDWILDANLSLSLNKLLIVSSNKNFLSDLSTKYDLKIYQHL